MTDHDDVEQQLRTFRHHPHERTKRAVMSAYEKSRGAGTTRRRAFWRRPVPLYAAAAVALVLVGVSFIVGRQVAAPGARRAATIESVPADGVATSQDIEWSVADRDLL